MLFGDPERKRREKRERQERQQLEAQHQKEINQAYVDAKVNRRIENAKIAAIRDADKMANKKPFYKILGGVAANMGKDLIKGAANADPNVFFTFDEKPKRRRRKRK